MQKQSKVFSEKAHLFDICGTLYKSNTTYDFMLFYFKNNNRYKYLVFKSLLSFSAKIIWKIFKLFGQSYKIRFFLLSFLKNEPVHLVKDEAQRFVEVFLRSKIIIDIANKLEVALNNNSGDVYLVSASIFPVVEAISNNLGVTNFYATELSEVNNRYTGKISLELEQNKKSVVDKIDLTHKQVVVYTDSFNDSDIIKISDYTVIVCNKEDKSKWITKFPDKKIEFCYV